MLSKEMENILNNQIRLEAQSSMSYLAMASWAECQPGLEGITEFFYAQSDEERVHMLKLVRYVNERGGKASIPAMEAPKHVFNSVQELFSHFLEAEIQVTHSIYEIVNLALQEKDFATHNFLQWYVTEQMEEEKSARDLNDKLEMIGNDRSGLYLFDRDIMIMRAEAEQNE